MYYSFSLTLIYMKDYQYVDPDQPVDVKDTLILV